MCLELFVMIRETPGIEPNPIVSPYVLTGKLSRENSPHFFKRFPIKQGRPLFTKKISFGRAALHPDKMNQLIRNCHSPLRDFDSPM